MKSEEASQSETAAEFDDARERVENAVEQEDVRAAFFERLGIPRELTEKPVDWARVLLATVPFQPRASQMLARTLGMKQALYGTVAGARVLIENAKDWGENEFVTAIAEHAWGDRAAVSKLDLEPFASFDGLSLLLEASPTINEAVGGHSALAAALQKRPSGVLVFSCFDPQSRVGRFIIDAVAAGHLTDNSGRHISVRSFLVVFLADSDPNRQERLLGFAPGRRPEAKPDGGLARTVDLVLRLERPDPKGLAMAVIAQAVDEFKEETGFEVRLMPSAHGFLESIAEEAGVTACRIKVRRMIEEAAASALERASHSGREFQMWEEHGVLEAGVSQELVEAPTNLRPASFTGTVQRKQRRR
jgi:hypothetical protein